MLGMTIILQIIAGCLPSLPVSEQFKVLNVVNAGYMEERYFLP